MRVVFFVEPFPVRGRPLDYQWIFTKWAALIPQLVERGVHCSIACSDAIADNNIETPFELHSPREFGVSGEIAELGSDSEWVRLMSEPSHPIWTPFVEELLDATHPDVVVSWTVNKPLQHAANERGIALLHIEVGPIRLSEGYLYYADPGGINGESSVRRVWPSIRDIELSEGEERRLDQFISEFVRDAQLPRASEDFRALCNLSPQKKTVGVFLQVSRDSNVLAWSTVGSNRKLLEAVALRFPSTEFQLLVKAHPGDPIVPEIDGVDLREAPACVAQQVIDVSDYVCLMNSSVGVEALAAEKPVYVFGESPYSLEDCVRVPSSTDDFAPFTDRERKYSRRLLHFLFARYLVGEEDLSDPDLFADRLERLIAWTKRGGTFSEWFSAGTAAMSLAETRARVRLVRARIESARSTDELVIAHQLVAELRVAVQKMEDDKEAARARLELIEPRLAKADFEACELASQLRATEEALALARRGLLERASARLTMLANALRGLPGATIVARVVKRMIRAPRAE